MAAVIDNRGAPQMNTVYDDVDITSNSGERQLSLQELLDLSLGVPEVGAVNFRILKAFLSALINNLGVNREASGVTNMNALSMVAGDDMLAIDEQHYAASLPSEQYGESSANDDAYGARQSATVPDAVLAIAEDSERAESIVELSRTAQGQHAQPSASQHTLIFGGGTRGTTSSPTLEKPDGSAADRKRVSNAVRAPPKKSTTTNPPPSTGDPHRRRSSGLTRLQQLIQPAIAALAARTEEIEKKLFMLENFPNTGDIIPTLDDAIGADVAEAKAGGTPSTSAVPTSVSSTTAARNSQKTRASQMWQQMKVGQRVDGVERAVEKLFALTDNVVHEMTEQMKATAKMSRRQAVLCKLLAFTGFRRFVANTDDEHLFDETPQTELEMIYPINADGKQQAITQTSPSSAAVASDAVLAGSNATTPGGTTSRYGVSAPLGQTPLNRLSPPVQQTGSSRRQSQQRQRPATSTSSIHSTSMPTPSSPSASLEQSAVDASTPGLYFKDFGFVPISKLEKVLPDAITEKLKAADPKLAAFIRRQSTEAAVSIPGVSEKPQQLTQATKIATARPDQPPSGGQKQSVLGGPPGAKPTALPSNATVGKNVHSVLDPATSTSAGSSPFSSSDRESLRLLANALQNIVPHYAVEAVIATQDGRLYSEVVSTSPSPATTPAVMLGTTPVPLETAVRTTKTAAGSATAVTGPSKTVTVVTTPTTGATTADVANSAAKVSTEQSPSAMKTATAAPVTAVAKLVAGSSAPSTAMSPAQPTYVPFQPSYASSPITISPEQMRDPNIISPYAMANKLSLTPPPAGSGPKDEYQPVVSGVGQRATSAPPRKQQPDGDITEADMSKTPGAMSGKRTRQEEELQQPLKKRMAESRNVSLSAEPGANWSPAGGASSHYMYPEQSYNDGSRSVSPANGAEMTRPLPVMTWDAFLNGVKRGVRHPGARSSMMVGTAFASPPPGEMQDVLEQFGNILSDHSAILNRLHEFENDLDQTRGEWDQRFSENQLDCHKQNEELQKKIDDFEARFDKHAQQQTEHNQTVDNRLDRHDSHINHLRSLVEGVTATVDYNTYQMTKVEQEQKASAEELREQIDVKLKEQTDSLVHFIYRQSELENATGPGVTLALNDGKQRPKSGASDTGSEDGRPLPQAKSLSRQKSLTRSKSRGGRDDTDDDDNKSTTSSSPADRSNNTVRMDDFTKLRNNFSAHRRDFLEFERMIYSQMSLLRTRCDDILKDMIRRVGGGAVGSSGSGRPNSASSSPNVVDENGNRMPKRTKSLHYDFEEALALAIQDIEKLQRIVEELSTNDQILGTKMRTLGELISRLDDSKASNDFVEHISGRKADRQELAKKLDSSSFEGTVKSIKRDVEQLDQFFHHFEQRVDHMVRRLRDNLASKLDKSEASGAVQSQQALVERFRSMESLVKSSIERVSGDEARAAGTHRPLACISCDKPAAQEFITGMDAALARHELRLTNVMANGVIKPYIDGYKRDDGCSDKDFNEAMLTRVAHERNVARLLAAQQSWAARWRTEWFDGPPGYPTTGPPALMTATDNGQQQQRWRRICGGDHTTVDKKKQFLKDKDLLTILTSPPAGAPTNGNGDEIAVVKTTTDSNKLGKQTKPFQQQGIGKLMRGLPSTKQKLLILAAQQALNKTNNYANGKQNQSARTSPRSRNTPGSDDRTSPEKRKSTTNSAAAPPVDGEQQKQLMLTTGPEIATAENITASPNFVEEANPTQAPNVPADVAV